MSRNRKPKTTKNTNYPKLGKAAPSVRLSEEEQAMMPRGDTARIEMMKSMAILRQIRQRKVEEGPALWTRTCRWCNEEFKTEMEGKQYCPRCEKEGRRAVQGAGRKDSDARKRLAKGNPRRAKKVYIRQEHAINPDNIRFPATGWTLAEFSRAWNMEPAEARPLYNACVVRQQLGNMGTRNGQAVFGPERVDPLIIMAQARNNHRGNCFQCGRHFTDSPTPKRYCSHRCSLRARRERAEQKKVPA